MLSHIHHINFVVKNLPSRVEYFSKLLQQEPHVEVLEQRQVTTAKYTIGETFLVLVQPLGKEGVVADILEHRGEGVFLLSFATKSIEQSLKDLELEALEYRKGIHDWEICDIADIKMLGTILQLTKD